MKEEKIQYTHEMNATINETAQFQRNVAWTKLRLSMGYADSIEITSPQCSISRIRQSLASVTLPIHW